MIMVENVDINVTADKKRVFIAAPGLKVIKNLQEILFGLINFFVNDRYKETQTVSTNYNSSFVERFFRLFIKS